MVVALLAVVFATVGFAIRRVPGHVPEAIMLQQVNSVRPGMSIEQVSRHFGFEPTWMKDEGEGYAVWRFEVSDVEYSARRASYFVKFEEQKMASGFLLYPIESAGGGMVF